MKKMSLRNVAIAGSVVACAALLSPSWSEQGGLSLSVESAQARVGRPLTPVSVAGVARRQTRRAVYGAGVVGAAAIGTSAYYGGGPYAGVGPYASYNNGVWVQPYDINGPRCQPGSLTRMDDGQMHVCQ